MFPQILRTYQTAFGGLSRENWLLALVMLINRMGTMAGVFMSVYVTYMLKRRLSEAGLVITLMGIGGVAGSLLGGYLVKKTGFRLTQISTSIATGILFIIFAQTANFAALCAISVIIGLVSEAFRPANFTAVAHYSKPETVTKSYSLNRFAINLGMGLGTGLGGLLASIDYHLLFIVEGITNIVVGLLIWALLPHVPKRSEAASSDVDSASSRSPWEDRKFLLFMLINFIYISSFLVMFKFAPVFWKDSKHIDEAAIGMILALNGLIIAVFEMILVQHLQTRKKDIQYIFYGVLMAAASYFCLVLHFVPAVLAALVSVILLTVSEMLALPFVNTFVVESSGPENRGSYAAVYTLVWSAAGIAAPGLGSFLADEYSYDLLWIVLILICLTSALAMKSLFGTKNKVEVQP